MVEVIFDTHYDECVCPLCGESLVHELECPSCGISLEYPDIEDMIHI